MSKSAHSKTGRTHSTTSCSQTQSRLVDSSEKSLNLTTSYFGNPRLVTGSRHPSVRTSSTRSSRKSQTSRLSSNHIWPKRMNQSLHFKGSRTNYSSTLRTVIPHWKSTKIWWMNNYLNSLNSERLKFHSESRLNNLLKLLYKLTKAQSRTAQSK